MTTFESPNQFGLSERAAMSRTLGCSDPFQHYSYWFYNTYGLHLLLEIYHLCGEH